MADRQCTRFIDEDGLDIGCALVTKEYMLEAYPDLVPWMKAPGLWLWGRNLSGRLGNEISRFLTRSSPVQTVSGGNNWKLVDTDDNKSAGVKTDGSLWIWGGGDSGSNGTENSISRSSPVQTISGGTNWRSVSVGSNIVSAIKTDGTLWMWGQGFFGSQGTNGTADNSSPVQTISGGTNWRSSSTKSINTLATKADGTLWAWGGNSQGSLGDNTIICRSSPVQTISGGTNWKTAFTTGSNSASIKTDGTLWLWGTGFAGKLGNNCTLSVSSPIQTVSGGTNWRSIGMSCGSTAATKTDGTLWTWGFGACGTLGTNSLISHSSPVQTISGGTNWRCVGMRESVGAAATKTDGTLWLWGGGSFLCSQLGDGTNIQRSSPVQTISGGTNWRSVVLSGSGTISIRDEEYY